ncbi:GEVED domain-containing protein [Larkinella insperata]|uniref:GEVED domain-containing protein n=1 Tax=Larkinella insperata TaxID=332158 RepID=A0ABW3QDI5_9BACT|nr:GEVED domain-containing protein [Larkinella insperata]
MKRLLSHCLTLCLAFKSIVISAQPFCATPPASGEQIHRLKSILTQHQAMAKQKRVATGTLTYIPLKAYFVRNSDGTGGAQISNLLTALAGMNTQFLPAGIQFYLVGSGPNFINNSSAYNLEWSANQSFIAANRDPAAANLFVVNSLTINGINYGGFGGDNVILTISSLTPALLTHEFGHHFSLLHTFGNGQELVSGANCATAADLICDTPADPWDLPGGGNTDDGSCTYKGGLADAEGRPYRPMVDNVMSGWQCSRTPAARFTAGQQQVMAASLAYWLQNPTPTRNYTRAPSTVAAPTLLSVTKISGRAQITWRDNSTNEAGFLIERAVGNPENFSAIGGVSPNVTTFTDAGIASSTAYHYRIRPANTSTGSLSNTVAFNAGLLYCIPRYFSPYPNSPANGNVGIDDVILQTAPNTVLLSNVGSGFSTGSYADFSASLSPATLTAGQSYSLTLKGKFELLNQANAAVWIDYNRDGSFGANERVLAPVQKLVSGTSLNASFTVPASALSGPTYMRVRIASLVPPDPTEVNDPCSLLYGKGEAEDYAVLLQSATPPAISIGVVTTVCAGAQISVPFSTTGSFPAGNTFKVQLSNATGSNFIDIPTSGTASPLKATIPATTPVGAGYRVRIVASSPAITSQVSTAFAIQPPATASLTGSTTINSGESVPLAISLGGTSPWSLTISASTGQTYPFAMSVSPFNLYVAPQQTTTYQIEQVRNSCGTGSRSGSATITVRGPCTLPTATLTGSTTLANGQQATLQVNFTGTPPYNFTLSNGQTFTNLTQNPFRFMVNPTQTTTYTVASVGNACGTGTTTGSATVSLEAGAGCPGLTASLTGNATITAGQSTPLDISLTGTGPWSLTISASTGENFSFTMPISRFYLYVAPNQTTTYRISQVRAACGPGTTAGSAVVTVRTPSGRVYGPFPPAFFVSEVRLSEAPDLLTRLTADGLMQEKSLRVSPNPTTGAITVDYRLRHDDGPVTIRLVNPSGVVVKTLLDSAASTAGAYSVSLSLAGLEPGSYILLLNQNGTPEWQRILLIR